MRSNIYFGKYIYNPFPRTFVLIVLIVITQAGVISEKAKEKKKNILVSIDRFEVFVTKRINIKKK